MHMWYKALKGMYNSSRLFLISEGETGNQTQISQENFWSYLEFCYNNGALKSNNCHVHNQHIYLFGIFLCHLFQGILWHGFVLN